jgi:hydroxypyruvate reductase
VTLTASEVAAKPEIVIVGPIYPPTQQRLEVPLRTYRLREAADQGAFSRRNSRRSARHPGLRAARLSGGVDRGSTGLEIIACFGMGVDLIDIAAVRVRGIPVTNTPDVVTDDTADFALALIPAVERRIAEGDRFVRRGDWGKKRAAFRAAAWRAQARYRRARPHWPGHRETR